MTGGQGDLVGDAADALPQNIAVAGSSARPASKGSSSLLRLRGLPFAASHSEVQSFFTGYETQEIYICRRDGRSTGEAYAVFKSPEDAQRALATLNKRYIGNRYIELFEAAESDLAAVKRVLEDSRLQGYVVRLRGLPYSATAADVMNFFSGVQLSEEEPAVVFAHSVDGRPTGEAYVELANEEALSLAMMRHKELMGNRYIEIFHSSKVDKLQTQQQVLIHQRASQSQQQRWPMFPGPGPTASAAGPVYGRHQHEYITSVSVDQLADTLRGTHIAPRSLRVPPTSINPSGVTPVHMQPLNFTGNMPGTGLMQPSRGIESPAAVGHAFCDSRMAVAASPVQAAARPGVQPVQVMAPSGTMLVAAEGQATPMYYIPPPHGVMWGGQGGIPRLAAPVGMVPVAPVSGAAPLVPAGVPVGVELASRGPVPAAWSQHRHHQPPVHPLEHRHQQQGYTHQYIYPQAGASALLPGTAVQPYRSGPVTPVHVRGPVTGFHPPGH